MTLQGEPGAEPKVEPSYPAINAVLERLDFNQPVTNWQLKKAWAEYDALQEAERERDEGFKQADELLRRLAEWDVMQAMGDGQWWKNEIARVRAALSSVPVGERGGRDEA